MHACLKLCILCAFFETAGYWRAGQKASMSILTLEMNSLSQFCYSFMYLMILLFWLRPNLAHKYSKIFSFIARARIFKALEVSFLSAYIFQEYQDKCSSAINEVKIDLLSKNLVNLSFLRFWSAYIVSKVFQLSLLKILANLLYSFVSPWAIYNL